MSQFPVENEPGLYEGINYLLSGPAGLGQNFEGFATFTPAYIRPTFRAPFTIPLDTTQNPNWYVAPINIGNIVVQGNVANSNSFYASYASTQSPAPYNTGDRVQITGVDPSFYNDSYTVLTGNVNGIVCATQNSYSWPAYVSGGQVSRDYSNTPISTDCNALVTIYGPTDQAFITAQLNLEFDYTASTASKFDVLVQINRYRAAPVIGQPGQYLFAFDTTVSEKRFAYSESTNGTKTLEAIFTTVLDSPGYGFYYYIMEVDFVTQPFYNSAQVGGPSTAGSLLSDSFAYAGNISSSYSTFTSLSPITVTGTGTGAVVDVDLSDIDSTYYNAKNTTVTVTTAGSNYQVGDTLKILGTSLGGTTPANDLTMTVSKVQYAGNALPGKFQSDLRSLTAQVIKE